MRKGRIKSPCVSLECIKTSVTVFHRTNLQAGKQHILVTCYIETCTEIGFLRSMWYVANLTSADLLFSFLAPF